MGCSGSEVQVQEKDVNLAKSGLKFDVKVGHANNVVIFLIKLNLIRFF